MKDKVPQNAGELLYSKPYNLSNISDVTGPFKECTLIPGNRIGGKWIIQAHLGNGCVYSVCREGELEKHALKIREPGFTWLYHQEKDCLQKINESGGHKAFQKLVEFNEKELYMILDPCVDGNNFIPAFPLWFTLPEKTIDSFNPQKFTEQLVSAFQFAKKHDINLQEALFYLNKHDASPFFIHVYEKGFMSNRVLFEGLFNRAKDVHTLLQICSVYQSLFTKETL